MLIGFTDDGSSTFEETHPPHRVIALTTEDSENQALAALVATLRAPLSDPRRPGV